MPVFRPQKMASAPLFMITFSIMAVGYTAWMIYEYAALNREINWFSVVFVLAVVAMLWYSRMTGRFYIQIEPEYIEWRVKRNSDERLDKTQVTAVFVHHYSIDFQTTRGPVELSLEGFDTGGIRGQVVESVVNWCEAHQIELEDQRA